MAQHELLPGLYTDVIETLREYCDVDRYAYLYFDSIDPGTDPNDLEPGDIWIANNLNGRIQLAEFAAIWERYQSEGEVVRSLLASIPVNAELWSRDEDVLRYAGKLLDMLCGPRAYAPRITKILHKKRPNLFPILDTQVLPLIERDVLPSAPDRSWMDYMAELARAVAPWIQRNADVLDEARKDFEPLTRLRAYDICLWKYATSTS